MQLRVICEGVLLAANEVAADPVAFKVSEYLRGADEFLAMHGAPAVARIPDGFTVSLRPSLNNAVIDEFGGVTFGGPNQHFRTSTALDPLVVGHEVGHHVHGSLTDVGWPTKRYGEGWPDVFGVFFAKHVEPTLGIDWRIGPKFAREGRTLRDLAAPGIRSISDIDPHAAMPNSYDLAGLITMPAVRALEELGPKAESDIGNVFVHALLHNLPARVENDVLARADELYGQFGTLPEITPWFEASANATMDAAREIGAPQNVRAAIEQGWRSSGLLTG